MLANIVGYEKFDQYIYGRKAFVETDHKPLVSITSSQCTKMATKNAFKFTKL